MLLVPEALVPSLVSLADAIASVERSFAAFDRGVARTYPKVREPLRQFARARQRGVGIEVAI